MAPESGLGEYRQKSVGQDRSQRPGRVRDSSRKQEFWFVLPSLRGGGMERVVATLVNYFVRHTEWKITLLLLSRAAKFYELDPRIRIIEPPQEILPKNVAVRYFRLFFFVRRLLRTHRPNAVIGFGESYTAFTILCSVASNVPVFVSNRASPESSMSGFRGILNPVLYPLASAVVVPTRKGIEILERRYKFVTFEKIGNPFQPVRGVQPISDRAKTIINVGYLGGNKNQDYLIRIFSELRCSGDWRLLLVGDGPNRRGLEKLIDELGLQGKVVLLGERGDVPDLLKDSQIFAFTSTSEGFPNALGEAMAAGCSCISFDCMTGPAELINHGENGLLVKLGDSDGYRDMLGKLMQDDRLRERIGEAAKKRIEREFGVERIAGQYMRLLSG